MKFIKQPYLSKQCGQTCLAMITGKTVNQICNELDNNYTTNIYKDLQDYLDKNEYKTNVVYGKKIDFKEVPNDSIIRLSKPCKGGHFIIKSSDKIFDPSVGIVSEYLNEYLISHFLTFKKL